MASMSDMINTISVIKVGCEQMCYKYPGQYPNMEKKKRVIKKVERYIVAIRKVNGTEETQEKVLRILYNYLDPFNSSDKDEKYNYLMAL